MIIGYKELFFSFWYFEITCVVGWNKNKNKFVIAECFYIFETEASFLWKSGRWWWILYARHCMTIHLKEFRCLINSFIVLQKFVFLLFCSTWLCFLFLLLRIHFQNLISMRLLFVLIMYVLLKRCLFVTKVIEFGFHSAYLFLIPFISFCKLFV